MVRDNLRYYDEYLRGERQKGRSEGEVLEELGDPRLIARTIIDTTPGAGNGGYQEYRGGIFDGGSRAGDSYREEYTEDGGTSSANGSWQNRNVHYYDLNKWYWKLLGIVVVIGIITLILAVVGGILTLVVPMLPVILMVMIIMWFVRGGPRG